MKLKEAIAKANELRLNTMPDEQKAGLLRDLDGSLLEMFADDWKPPAPPPEPTEEEPKWPVENTWPEEDPELLLPFPHEAVYILYLCAQIDYFNMEIDLYQNDMTAYNLAMGEARGWWRRHRRPWRNFNWRVM